jgi:hypothetical protein
MSGINEAIRAALGYADALCKQGEWAELDAAINAARDAPAEVGMSFLTVTLGHGERLPSRGALFEAVALKLTERGADARRELEGLR